MVMRYHEQCKSFICPSNDCFYDHSLSIWPWKLHRTVALVCTAVQIKNTNANFTFTQLMTARISQSIIKANIQYFFLHLHKGQSFLLDYKNQKLKSPLIEKAPANRRWLQIAHVFNFLRLSADGGSERADFLLK